MSALEPFALHCPRCRDRFHASGIRALYRPAFLMSIRPKYAALIAAGRKEVEYRRRVPSHPEWQDYLLYVTSPRRVLLGGFRTADVVYGSPDSIWADTSRHAGIDRADFDAYFEGSTRAYAMYICDLWQYADPPGLVDLRRLFPGFTAPQSWRALKPRERQVLFGNLPWYSLEPRERQVLFGND